ncbi:MAG: hypothetical protein PHG63_02900 [Candidatus Dojkabacteria bacterium]|nr:hypothetical protein [Candidatus Dojkabacteria bacterium]
MKKLIAVVTVAMAVVAAQAAPVIAAGGSPYSPYGPYGPHVPVPTDFGDANIIVLAGLAFYAGGLGLLSYSKFLKAKLLSVTGQK